MVAARTKIVTLMLAMFDKEKVLNYDDLKAWKSFDHNPYAYIPGWSNNIKYTGSPTNNNSNSNAKYAPGSPSNNMYAGSPTNNMYPGSPASNLYPGSPTNNPI